MPLLLEAWPAKEIVGARSREGKHVDRMAPTLKVRLKGYVVRQRVCQAPRPRRRQYEKRVRNLTYFIHFEETRVDFAPVRNARRDRVQLRRMFKKRTSLDSVDASNSQEI